MPSPFAASSSSTPNDRRRTDRDNASDSISEPPFLTHKVRHHGQITLVPPESQGRMRQRSPDATNPRRRRKKKAAASVAISEPNSASTSQPHLPLPVQTQTVVDYTIPSRPRLRQVVSSTNASLTAVGGSVAGSSVPSISRTSTEERVPRSISPVSLRSAPGQIRSSRPESRQRSRRRSVDEIVGGLPAAIFSNGLLAITGPNMFPDSLDLPPPYTPPLPSSGHSAPLATARETETDPVSPPPPLPPNPQSSSVNPTPSDYAPKPDSRPDFPDETSSTSSMSVIEGDDHGEGQGDLFLEAWERDREAGFSLEERVRRDFERRKENGAVSDQPSVTNEMPTEGRQPRDSSTNDVATSPIEVVSEGVGTEPSAADPPQQSTEERSDKRSSYVDASVQVELPPSPENPSSSQRSPTLSRPLPRPPPVSSPRPTSAYFSLFHEAPPVSPAQLEVTSEPVQTNHTPHTNDISPPAVTAQQGLSPTSYSGSIAPTAQPSSLEEVSNPTVHRDLSVVQSQSSPPHHSPNLHDDASRGDIIVRSAEPSQDLFSGPSAPQAESAPQAPSPLRKRAPPPLPPRRREPFSTPSRPEIPLRQHNSPPSAFPSLRSPTFREGQMAEGTHSDELDGAASPTRPSFGVTGSGLSIRDRIDRLEALSSRRRPPPPPPPRRPPRPPSSHSETGESRAVHESVAAPNLRLTGSAFPASHVAMNSIGMEVPRNEDLARSPSGVRAPEAALHSGIPEGSSEALGAAEPSLERISPPTSAAPRSEEVPEPGLTLTNQAGPSGEPSHGPSPPHPSVVDSSLYRGPGYEYTDLDLLVARLDNQEAVRQGVAYNDLLTLSEILGPANHPSSSSTTAPHIQARQIVEDLPVAPVQIERRRVTKDGRTKLKLSLMGVMVDRCSVCMNQFRKDDMGVLLPCQHAFHPKCVTSWLSQHLTCPMCRTSLLPNDNTSA